jgi:hypothetical protein
MTQHNEIPGWRSTPSRDSLYRRVRNYAHPARTSELHKVLHCPLVDALPPDCHAPLLPRLLTVRASLARVLGWMAYDAGDLVVTGHHYELARRAADEAANPAMTALVLCNMSIAATRGGHPGVGADHAVAARY